MAWSIPERIGPYRIVRQLANGGTANIFEVFSLNGSSRLALKQSRADANSRRSVEKEYRILKAVRHPNIVRAHHLGEAVDGTAYMTMDLLSGVHPLFFSRNLGPPGHPDRTIGALGIIIDISAAVQALHEASWIHRDIKSANVMLLPNGQSILIDPGAACPRGDPRHRGGFIGTRAYAPPEQMLGRKVDERADVYALGVLSYRLLTGRSPYPATDTYQCLQQKLSHAVPSVHACCPELPQQAARLLQQMMSPDACERPSLDQIEQTVSNGWAGAVDRYGHRQRILNAMACRRQPVSSAELHHSTACTQDILYAQLLCLVSEGLVRATETGWCLRASSIRATPLEAGHVL